jgi:dipeptidase D
MRENSNCELLFTCDEEIGLIGANNINLNIQSKYMLNLDSEQEGEICIGCAGGIDIFATNNNSKLIPNSSDKTLYEITISNLDGGHSGVDIDKNIPNGIKLLANIIKDCDGDILDINGGERINSIPKSAKAIIATNNEPKSSNPNITIDKIDTPTQHYKRLDSNILKFLSEFKNGVLEYDDELDVVISSVNLSIISTNIDDVKIELSARSMDNEKLKTITKNTINTLESLGFKVTTNGKYPAWKPDINEFTNDILKIYKQTIPDVALKAIHAGLECAIFKDKFPDIKIASIGPNIYFPHSFNEKVEIKSIHNIYQIIKDILYIK